MKRHAILHEWGIRMPDTGPLGDGWFTGPCEPWPKRFKTRAEARVTARGMTEMRRYLGWTFKPIKLTLSIRWTL